MATVEEVKKKYFAPEVSITKGKTAEEMKKKYFDGDGENHGNTRLPYGLAKGRGLNTEGKTPREVWDMLKGYGITPEEEYKKLEENEKTEVSEKNKAELKAKTNEQQDGSLKFSDKTIKEFENFRAKRQKLGHEEAVCCDAEGNIIIDKRGRTDSVGFTQTECDKMRGGDLIHNHPQGNTFLSTEDVKFLFEKTNMRSIEATGYDGTIHRIGITKKTSKENINQFCIGYSRAVSRGVSLANNAWAKVPKKIVTSGSKIIMIPKDWNLYRKNASARDRMNFIEFAKIVQDEVKKFCKDSYAKYNIYSEFIVKG